jgi:branched-subunit amino acid aminotransferase/4-amino-4-deoxychorismate lyase
MTQTGLPALFETMRVLGGMLPFLERHVTRLVDSCPAVDLMPPPEDLLAEATAHGLRPPGNRVVRVEWNGASLVWEDRELPSHEPIHLALADEIHTGYPVKSSERQVFDRAAREVEARGAGEPLLLTQQGWIAEGARYAIAWLEDDRLRAPELSLQILPSIGGARLREVASDLGLEVETGRFGVAALGDRPIVLVNAVRGVVPVASWNGTEVPRDSRISDLAERFWP